MTTIYVDNFRGFTKTFFDLKNVNFFMGENSTGKTSLLSLIHLLGSPRFWLSSDFSSEYVDLGVFEEIAGPNGKRNEFKIGILRDSTSTHGLDLFGPSEDYNAILLTFRPDRDGISSISEFSYLTDSREVRFVHRGNVVYYRIKRLGSSDNQNRRVKNCFMKWLDTSERTTGFKKLDKQREFLDLLQRLPKSVAIRAVEGLVGEEMDKKQREFSGDVVPRFYPNVTWIGPIRSEPQRSYDRIQRAFSPEGAHSPYLLKDILETASLEKDRRALMQFGRDSSLFDGIRIKKFSKSSKSPFELDIVLNGKSRKISNVGYGVSQSLPLVVEILSRGSETWFAIQQPEIHLHPKAQALWGEFVFQQATNMRKSFLIETHSDYIIDRYRMMIRENANSSKTKIDSQALFCERTDLGNRLHSINIDSRGNFSIDQPKGFRDFFLKEQFRLIGI